MSEHEFTGKTVKEAVEKACRELNTEPALLDVHVVEESARGFLGIVGQRDARVVVKKRNILKEVMEAEETGEDPPAVETIDSEKKTPEKGTRVATQRQETREEPPPETMENSEPDDEAKTDFTVDEEAITEARTVLQGILDRMMVDAVVESQAVNGSIYLDIKGDGSGILIGKKGQTLDALQFLVNKIVKKNAEGDSKTEVVVDTENYRLRKRENLRETALKISRRAKKSLKPVSFNPMPPHERRLVHLILAEDRDVYTKSYGEGPMRRIIVYPRRGSSNKRRGR